MHNFITYTGCTKEIPTKCTATHVKRGALLPCSAAQEFSALIPRSQAVESVLSPSSFRMKTHTTAQDDDDDVEQPRHAFPRSRSPRGPSAGSCAAHSQSLFCFGQDTLPFCRFGCINYFRCSVTRPVDVLNISRRAGARWMGGLVFIYKRCFQGEGWIFYGIILGFGRMRIVCLRTRFATSQLSHFRDGGLQNQIQQLRPSRMPGRDPKRKPQRKVTFWHIFPLDHTGAKIACRWDGLGNWPGR